MPFKCNLQRYTEDGAAAAAAAGNSTYTYVGGVYERGGALQVESN